MEEPEVMAIVISMRLWLAEVIAEKCSAALPTIGRMMRPTKKGLSPIWWVNGSIVLTNTSLMTAVTAVAAASAAMGNQSVVFHHLANSVRGFLSSLCFRTATSPTGAFVWTM